MIIKCPVKKRGILLQDHLISRQFTPKYCLPPQKILPKTVGGAFLPWQGCECVRSSVSVAFFLSFCSAPGMYQSECESEEKAMVAFCLTLALTLTLALNFIARRGRNPLLLFAFALFPAAPLFLHLLFKRFAVFGSHGRELLVKTMLPV